ncbi:hypothetical protein SANA_14310 [Gottschalkiaceae bacterium SANA]|nr:hypothetical protein SANA_14310 [Gottschalkiaceae bacterium SANA]
MKKLNRAMVKTILEPSVKKTNAFFLCVILLIVFFARLSPEKDLGLVQEKFFSLNDQWTVISGANRVDEVTLPYQIPSDQRGEHFLITKTINEDFEDEMYLRIRASMQDIRVMAKGEVIYQSERDHEGSLVFPEVSMWHLIKLPRDMKGEILTIDFSTNIEAFKGMVNGIYYGSEGALLKDLVARNYTGLLVGIIMLLAGITSIIVSFSLRKLGDRRLFYIGVFSITASIWMFSELRILQFITGNRFILGGISYFMVPLIGFSLIRYLGIVVLMKYSKSIDRISFVLAACFIFLFFAQLIGGLPLISGLLFVNVLMGLIIVWVTTVILYESIGLKNKRAIKYGLYMSVLVASQVMEIIVFFTKDFDRMSHFSKLGDGIFLGFMLWESISYFKSILRLNQKTKILEEMAYKDSLVEGNNRAAYERDLDQILDSIDIQSFRLVLIDINQLKQINDVFGHATGDKAIIRSYQLMCQAFEDIGTCYRLGGDEFAGIVTETNEVVFYDAIKALEQGIEQENNQQKYPFSLAIGSGFYEKDHIDERKKFSTFFHEVDQRMYSKKKRRYSEWSESVI